VTRYKELGDFVKEERTAAGFASAAALAQRAGLSYNYVSILERGTLKPKPATVEALSDALGLSAAKREQFHRLAVTAGQPESVKAVAPPLIPGAVVLRNLSAAIFAVEHQSDPPGAESFADTLLFATIQPISAVLAWIELSERPKLTQAALRQVSDAWTKMHSVVYSAVGYADNHVMRARALVSTWRTDVFGSQRRAAALAGRLRRWKYHLSSTSLRLDFGDADDQRRFGIASAQAMVVAELHEAMMTHALCRILNTTVAELYCAYPLLGHVADQARAIIAPDFDEWRDELQREGLAAYWRACDLVDDASLALRCHLEPGFAGRIGVPPADELSASIDVMRLFLTEAAAGFTAPNDRAAAEVALKRTRLADPDVPRRIEPRDIANFVAQPDVAGLTGANSRDHLMNAEGVNVAGTVRKRRDRRKRTSPARRK
jgi:transcriptional regulator with XRE-family HTH domain